MQDNDCDPTSRVSGKLAAIADDAVRVTGRSVHFRHLLETYCNAVGDSALTVATTVHDSDIVVTEWFEGAAVRCVCQFPVSGTIDNLSPGHYRFWILHSIGLTGVPEAEQPDPRVLYQGSVTIAAG